MIEHHVRTITSVLHASIGCKVLRFSEKEVLQVGSSMCSRDCMDLVTVCGDVLGKLKFCSESLNGGMYFSFYLNYEFSSVIQEFLLRSKNKNIAYSSNIKILFNFEALFDQISTGSIIYL